MSARPGMNKARILITAGPTRERIDPVRYISNYSTGTFGYEMAKEARRRGHRVTLVSGPTALAEPKGVRVIGVESAQEMYRAVMRELGSADFVIMAAAVADWRPRKMAQKKSKKGSRRTLELVENIDILRAVGKHKDGRVVVGFALETDNLEKNAIMKLRQKGADIIVANRITKSAAVFGDRMTDILMIDRYGGRQHLRHRTKRELAKNILDKVFGFNYS